MSLPFTQEQFLEVMQRYNEAVWPAQVALNALGLAALAALAVHRPGRDAFIAGVLALLWAWSAVVYHLLYFYEINPAAALFGVMFLAAGALFGWQGVVEQRLRFAPRAELRTFIGAVLVAYALIGYPLLAVSLGHRYPQMPTFGLPCPITIFTLGMAAFLRPPYPRYLFLLPLLWVLIASQAAFRLGMYEDLGLLPAGLVGLWLAWHPAQRVRLA